MRSVKKTFVVFACCLSMILAALPALPARATDGESWLWPLAGYTSISSGYGWRTHPTQGGTKFHYGIDIPAPTGTPIRAAQSGYLVVEGFNQYRGYWSVIDHQNGTYSEYQHMSAYAISSNCWVNQGDIIGYVGATGDSQGAHLHFEIATGAVNQAGNYGSLTKINPAPGNISYVYNTSQLVPDISGQTPVIAPGGTVEGEMGVAFNAVSGAHHYDIVLFGTNHQELNYWNVGQNTGGVIKFPCYGGFYIYVYAYSASGARTISKPLLAFWSGPRLNLGESLTTAINSKNGKSLYIESDGTLRTGSLSADEKDLDKYFFTLKRMTDDNVYAIYNAAGDKALTVESGGFQNGTGLSFQPYTGSDYQKFVIKENGRDGSYMIFPAGSGYVLDAGNSSSNRQYLYIQCSYNNVNQYYSFYKLTMKPRVTGYAGTYDGRAHTIGIDSASLPDGAKVEYRVNESSGWSTEQPTRADVGETTVYYRISHKYYNTATGSAKVQITPREESASLEKPTVESIGNAVSGIRLQWERSSGAEGYIVYHRAGSGKWEEAQTTEDTAWTDVKATANGTKYQYKVCAYNGSETSAASAVKTLYRMSRSSIKSAYNASGKKIVVSWSRNTKASGYQIKYAVGSKSKVITVKGGKSVKKTISGLQKGTTYKVYVRSYRSVSGKKHVSAWSKKKSVKVKK